MVFPFPLAHFAQSIARGTALQFDGVEERLTRVDTVTASAPDAYKTTVSVWVRIAEHVANRPIVTAYYGSTSTFLMLDSVGRLSRRAGNLDHVRTVAAIPTGEWVHIVYQFDSTLADENERVKFFFNGVREAVSYPGNKTEINRFDGLQSVEDAPKAIGWLQPGIMYDEAWFLGDMALLHLVDGEVIAPVEFGETIDGRYQAKRPTPTYSVSGYFLPFVDPDDIGADFDNGNDWTVANMDATNLRGDGPYVSF